MQQNVFKKVNNHMTYETKTCATCARELITSNFFKSKQNKDGLRHECRDCYRKKYVRPKPKKALNEYCVPFQICGACGVKKDYNYYTIVVDSKNGLFKFCKACCVLEMNKHSDFLNYPIVEADLPVFIKKNQRASDDFRKYFLENSRRESLKKWRNRPIVAERLKAQNERYKKAGKLQQYRNTYFTNKPQAKIAANMRGRIRGILIRQAQSKKGKSHELLGCSWDKLKEHLESNFLPGMTWENYKLDGWHIDHIIPCVNFDLSKKEEQLKCFHFTNLQPLWCTENLAKRWSDKELYK